MPFFPVRRAQFMAVFWAFRGIGCAPLCATVHASVWHLAWYELRNGWYEASSCSTTPRSKPKAKDTAYKLGDSGQLYLYVTLAGGRHWWMNYAYGEPTKPGGRMPQNTLSLGSYPALTLSDARRKRDEAKATLADGRDPAVKRKITAKARAFADGNTFEIVARRWDTLRKPNRSTVHAEDVIESLENDIFPAIGDLPIRLILAPKLLEVLNKVEERGAIETAHRLRQRVSSIFVYGIAAGLCEADPAASLGKALKKQPRATKQPSIIDGIED
ncbi:integrase arm-type DNA-binding domain-containing protein [Sphingomonas sp. 4RDLI-65]|uniref:tyrosine-type recombinase/integrase n=1 Tax=Sphingomonas sp. 4RDLI-65 TaxID=3111641 RepID=UPI003C163BBB